MAASDGLYRVRFEGTRYSQPGHEVTKLDSDYNPLTTYFVTSHGCECAGFQHRYGRRRTTAECRHMHLRDYYEAHSRPVCFLRVSGTINIFQVPLEEE